MENREQSRCLELAKTSSFYRRIYAEVEEVGWEHLVRLGEDLTFLTFRVIDKKKRVHVLEITLDKAYPKYPPSVSADVPYIFNLEWSTNKRLKDILLQFQEHLDKLQGFWSTLDDVDQFPWVADLKHSRCAISYRQINLGNDCCIMISLDPNDPRAIPECRFLGPEPNINLLRNKWRRNCKSWNKDRPFSENLVSLLEIQIPRSVEVLVNDQQTECGICYAQRFPFDDEHGGKSGIVTDYTCENKNCNRVFHSICLGDWLRSLTTTRQSFDVLFGNCPYCSDPVAVKMSTIK